MEMSRIESSLNLIERRLRQLVEGDPAGEGISRKLHRQLEQELVAAMRTGMNTLSGPWTDGNKPAPPDEYTLVLPTQPAELLLDHPGELDGLARQLEAAADRAGFRFANAPILRVVADPGATRIKVMCGYSHTGKGNSHTAVMEGYAAGAGQASAEGLPKAFLIVNGLATYPLTRAVTNVGRDIANHVQIDDPRISRLHAQIRCIQGRFVIFDLDSTGGVTVNGVSVTSHVLSPGDVIRLAGVPVVYGQEQELQDGYTQEVPAGPPQPETL